MDPQSECYASVKDDKTHHVILDRLKAGSRIQKKDQKEWILNQNASLLLRMTKREEEKIK